MKSSYSIGVSFSGKPNVGTDINGNEQEVTSKTIK